MDRKKPHSTKVLPMEFLQILCFCLWLFSCLPLPSHGQNLVEIQVKTSDIDNAGYDGPPFPTLEIVNLNFDSCVITDLQDPEGPDQYARDWTDAYSKETVLGACYYFPMPEGQAPILTLSLLDPGEGMWNPEYVRLLLDDSTYLMCYDGNFLDSGSQFHDLECVSFGKEK